MSRCRESCHPVPMGRGPGEPPAIPSWCCCSSGILWDKSPVECCSRDEGMIPPPRFSPRDKQKVPQKLITPKLGLPAACPKLQLSRREQTAPRLVSLQGNPAPGRSAPALFHLVHLLLVPRISRRMQRCSGMAWAADSGAVAVWSQPEHSRDTSHGRMWAEGVEQSLWQQLKPLPPADSDSALLSI